jgi:hypothetical protein
LRHRTDHCERALTTVSAHFRLTTVDFESKLEARTVSEVTLMSSEHPEESSEPAAPRGQMSDARQGGGGAGDHGPSDDATTHGATVVVRGETIRDPESKSPPEKKEPPRKDVSPGKIKLQSHLPALEDDADVGVQKEHIVVRDGEADLAFTGTLLASAAPSSAPKGHWQEYRIYETNAGKHVFSKVNRSVFAEDQDSYEAEVFDPSPSSVPSQLLRSARELARSRPLTWMDAAVAFFGYDPLAKALYRKLSGQFEEHIS